MATRWPLLGLAVLILAVLMACSRSEHNPEPPADTPKNWTVAEIAQTDGQGRNMIHRAVLSGDPALLKTLMQPGIDINAKDKDGCTALHHAVTLKNHEALRILIDHGADISIPLPDGGSPLKHAVHAHDVTAAEFLFYCDQNQDIELREDSENYALGTFAIRQKHYATAEMFVWPMHYIVKRDKPQYFNHLIAVNRRLVGSKDMKQMTPLHIACLYRNEGFVDRLTAAGADVAARDAFGKRPEDYSADKFQPTADTDTLDDRVRACIEDRMLDFLVHHQWMTVGVIRDGRIAFLKSYGKVNHVDQDAVHASVSKPMTSVIAIRLLNEGAIRSLDDPIAAYSRKYRDVMPAAFRNDSITFRHLLTHTSGIPHLNKPLWVNGKLNLLSKPGARFEYSTNGYSILGEVLAESAGKSFSDLVREHIGQPIGAASFWAEDTFRAPAARIHSTPRDFARFAAGIINGDYMSAEDLDSILVGRKREESLGWGTGGIGTDDLTLAHSGSNGKPRSHMVIKPKRRTAIVLMGETKTPNSDIWFLHLAPILMDIIEGKGDY